MITDFGMQKMAAKDGFSNKVM